ncbi:peptide methionine sulfoxide reductase [Heterostelium album PN500]|uniref:peptide-methionine (S)-S-oxide reductase n=1 Tax=Heterostelium pallidum (strain ATCC 26659 / Pp 5 / PN500) TaxID=670386 RepID=D3BVG1_HETP5|nr:peptide methionine sulfoxide reductase [Heterostelium album PN500]EFA74584.1 peptide methionine sulfoxide reductase [Heterostelium album PN500]|eukprot:XP_020426718.1 peptide methionine sulfoxide reductase [Heterostelium album PN500]
MVVEKATFAAGCFWSVELVFQRMVGVLSTRVGYTNGVKLNPTYKEVCTGTTGHAEAVELEFDPAQVSYGQLLDVFWKKHDPTTLNRQGGDQGTQYRSGIYYHNDRQHTEAEESKKQEQLKYKQPIVTEILPAGVFYPAEEYHQQYLQKGGQCSSKGCTDKIRCYG